jgi:predicted nucleic acid-binding protein
MAWAQIRADRQRLGRAIERQDAWIAAVAVALNVPLVTHNAGHFAQIPLLQVITEPDI